MTNSLLVPHHVVVANWITMIAVEKMMFSSWLFIMYILVLAFMNWFFFSQMQNWTVSDLFHPQKATLGSVISVYLSAPHMEDCEIKIIWRKQQRTTGLCWFLNALVVLSGSTRLRFVLRVMGGKRFLSVTWVWFQ